MKTKILRLMRSRWLAPLLVGLGGLFTCMNLASAQPWAASTAPSFPWASVAASADGTHLVAVRLSFIFGNGYFIEEPAPIYLSTNAGASWTATSSPNDFWASVWSSADGTRLVAASSLYDDGDFIRGSGLIYTSADSGATWTPGSAPVNAWTRVAASADGNKMVAAAAGIGPGWNIGDGSIYSSTNSGTSWVKTSAPAMGWTAVAASADGSKLAAIGADPSISPYAYSIYTSDDSGATWTQTSAPMNNWTSLASSADGTKLVGVSALYRVAVFSGDGRIYTSSDSGKTWTATSAPTNTWQTVAASADGTELVAAAEASEGNGLIYVSTNSGATWTATGAPMESWTAVALSADSYRSVAGSSTALLCTLPYSGVWKLANAPRRMWDSVAVSADGTRLIVAGSGSDYTSTFYISSDFGTSGSQISASNHWTSVASSADGTKLVAAASTDFPGDGLIYTSNDSGAHWARSAAPTNRWASITSSGDASRLLAAADYYLGDGRIYASIDLGTTWTQTAAPSNWWTSVAASADGTKDFAAGDGTTIYLSTNSGISWFQSGPTDNWACLASSADGSKVVAAATLPIQLQPGEATSSPNYDGSGRIYVSTDAGVTWIPTSAPSNFWASVACSADGTRLFAVAGGKFYASSDSGLTWTASETPAGRWRAVACTADGTNIVTVGDGLVCTLNFSAPAPPLVPPSPMLSIGLSGGNAVLSWLVPSTSFILQENGDLISTNWVDVTTRPVLNPGHLQEEVDLPFALGKAFYRLRQQ